jgi:hypothetical protein
MSYIGGAFNAITPINLTGSSSASGIAGFHLGYNYQMPTNWVLGIEGDWDWTKLKSSAAPGRAIPSAVFVGAGPGKFATDENVSAAGFDPLVVQFALGD